METFVHPKAKWWGFSLGFALLMMGLLTGCATQSDLTVLTPSPDNSLAVEQLRTAVSTRLKDSALAQVVTDCHDLQQGQLQLLYGVAFVANRAERQLWFDKSKESALRSLRAAQAFPEAADFTDNRLDVTVIAAVTEPGFEPLFLWATAVFYTFRDVLGPIQRIQRRADLSLARQAIQHIYDLDPQWGEGALPFSLGIYYLAVPTALGGDRILAANFMAEAVDRGPDNLLPRWGRAKYLAVALRDPQTFYQDLSWVVQQNWQETSGPELWRKYFHLDAQQLLRQHPIIN